MKVGVVYLKLISQHSPGGTDGNHENLNQDRQPLALGIETGTSEM